MLRTVLFDLGNVLLFFSHDKMYENIGVICDRSGEEIRTFFDKHHVITEFECGRMSRADLHRLFESEIDCQLDRRRLMRAISHIFTPNESLLKWLDPLKEAGVRLVLLSNTNAAHIAYVKKQYDLLDKFDDLVLSYEVGAMKPDPPIFEAALSKIECDPSECFYTDDIVENVERARGFGIQAEVFIDARTFLSHLQRRNLFLKEPGAE